eukprot:UN11235
MFSNNVGHVKKHYAYWKTLNETDDIQFCNEYVSQLRPSRTTKRTLRAKYFKSCMHQRQNGRLWADANRQVHDF